MKTLVKLLYIFFSLTLIFYLLIPDFDFPKILPDALQSNEPADTETPLRRAYFTNFDREEVMNHYVSQFKFSNFLNFPLPTYRLNYPPEEAKTIIRDQTRSTFLEEIVHPFRESVFVNGFEPKEAKDVVFIEGRKWRQKIIIKQIASDVFTRVFIGLAIVFIIPIIAYFWKTSLLDLRQRV